MNATQKDWIDNMTPARAAAVLRRFRNDPAKADAAGAAAYAAFVTAWEVIHPTQYVQAVRMAGHTRFNIISLA